MLVVRPIAMIKDRVLRRQVRRIWVKPHVDVLRPNRNDAAVMSGSRDFGRRFVCDRRERQQGRLSWRSPLRPKACNQHVLSRSRFEFQDHVLDHFVDAEFASLDAMPVHVFVERVDDGNPVRVAKETRPTTSVETDAADHAPQSAGRSLPGTFTENRTANRQLGGNSIRKLEFGNRPNDDSRLTDFNAETLSLGQSGGSSRRESSQLRMTAICWRCSGPSMAFPIQSNGSRRRLTQRTHHRPPGPHSRDSKSAFLALNSSAVSTPALCNSASFCTVASTSAGGPLAALYASADPVLPLAYP